MNSPTPESSNFPLVKFVHPSRKPRVVLLPRSGERPHVSAGGKSDVRVIYTSYQAKHVCSALRNGNISHRNSKPQDTHLVRVGGRGRLSGSWRSCIQCAVLMVSQSGAWPLTRSSSSALATKVYFEHLMPVSVAVNSSVRSS